MTELFSQWCLVELFGHSRIAGLVTEQTIGGQSFVRVDVPATASQAAFTRLFGAGAIYAINPMAEDVVRSVAESLKSKPITEWDLPDKLREAMHEGMRLLEAKPAENEEPVDEDDDLPM